MAGAVDGCAVAIGRTAACQPGRGLPAGHRAAAPSGEQRNGKARRRVNAAASAAAQSQVRCKRTIRRRA
ncbi:MAG TPA: hypothetical protein VHJ18_10075 [Streptosporangiaceae bacterium]|nr:hypothetical protein [Streptosporangiaceae bacterium]